MIKSILVALDESPSSDSAKKLAVHLAKLYKASLSGIGILDEPWIAAPEAIPLGGAAFKVELDEQLLSTAKRHVTKLEKAFVDFCKTQGTSCSIIDTTGVPSYEIEHFLIEHDILIIGKDATFHLQFPETTSVSVKQLLKDNPRPIIATGPHLPHQESANVLVAFDGTFASSRALHMAILMGIFQGKTVHIASVSENEEEALDYVNIAAKLCHNHGINTHLHPLATSDKPAKALLNLIEGVTPSLLVVGAYGRGGLSRFFQGSCVEELLKSTDVPVFIFH